MKGKQSISCDDVFETLTRGPFLGQAFRDGDEIDAVERHVAECPDCARLAYALQPALDLFHEALDGDEIEDLPEYWGQLKSPNPPKEDRGHPPEKDSQPRTSNCCFPDYGSLEGQDSRDCASAAGLTRPSRSEEGYPSSCAADGVEIQKAQRATARPRWLFQLTAAAVLMALSLGMGWFGGTTFSGVSRTEAKTTGSDGEKPSQSVSPWVVKAPESPGGQITVSLACLTFSAEEAADNDSSHSPVALRTIGVCLPRLNAEPQSEQPASDRQRLLNLTSSDLDCRLRCCNQCHNRPGPAAGVPLAVASLVRSCTLCHLTFN